MPVLTQPPSMGDALKYELNPNYTRETVTLAEGTEYALPSGESFSFTVHAVYLPRPRIEISGPQGVQATFDWQAARDNTLGRMCTATLINDREEY